MMRKWIPLLLVMALVIACSSDSSDDTVETVSMEDDGMTDDDSTDDTTDDGDDDSGDDADDGIVLVGGTWALTDLEIDEEIDDTDLELAELIVEELAALECYLLTFVFNDDGTVLATDKLSYLDIDSFSVSCPEEQDEETLQWILEVDQLTLTDEDGDQETLTVQINEGGNLVIGAENLDPEYEGADAIFTLLDQQ